MRRFACHYLYVSADGCYSKYVVELEDSGRVRAYFPLKEELSATQWIGGVIIISPMYGLEICSGEKFADFLQENTAPAAAPRRALFLLLPHRNNIPVNLINM